jgi:hypothetical protein
MFMIRKKREAKEPEEQAFAEHCRRGEERRRRHISAFMYQFINPRRRKRRRQGDAPGFHADFHEPMMLAVVLITVSLCIADIYITLTLLDRGGTELNPIMAELIYTDQWLFFVVKYSLTALGLFVLLSYRDFRFFNSISVLHMLYGILAIYVILVIYQIGLLAAASR